MTTKTTKRAPKGTPTDLNVWVLGDHAAGRREFANRISPTSRTAFRRLLKAGYIEILPDLVTLRITDAGVAAVNALRDRYPTSTHYAAIEVAS